jgi:hypothetical protein
MTQRQLKQMLRYDPRTGLFYWRAGKYAGKRAGWLSNEGYRYIQINLRVYAAHTLAWLYVRGRLPKGRIDHIDRKPANNRIKNLREATRSQNSANSINKPNRSGLKGAHYARGHWQSAIHYKGRKYYLGFFATPEAAHRAYCKAARALHGNFFYRGKRQ